MYSTCDFLHCAKRLAHVGFVMHARCLLGALVDKLDMEQERAYEFAERSVNRNAYLRLTHIELKMKHTRDSFETSNKGIVNIVQRMCINLGQYMP